ncbi:MAG: glycine zipper 2TM domain-containing protein [Pseudomonadota bacterium]
MNKSMLIGTVLGVGVATAGGAIAGYQYLKEPNYAEVVDAVPVIKKVKVPRKECHDETVVHQREVKDQNRIAGKAVGAILGGVLGHQVGNGNGKKVATVAGAVAGGYAGDRVQNNMQKKDTYTTVEQRCNTVYSTREDITGYDVTYRLKDKEDTVRMSYDPGRQIPVQDGRLVLDSDTGPARR